MTPDPRNHMFLRSEIRDQVAALALAMRSAQQAGADATYVAGYLAALSAVLVAFGVDVSQLLEIRRAHDLG